MLHCLSMQFMPLAADGSRLAEHTVHAPIPDEFAVVATRVGLARQVCAAASGMAQGPLIMMLGART
jgi:hypothetical protein